MIRIERTPEPSTLPALRAVHLDAARDARRVGAKIDFSGYGEVKDDLFAMQYRKCCYCEKLQEQAKYRDVEHYRPKSRYWWLAWTWNNLMFCCIDCNREYKGTKFPLTANSVRLIPEQSPPGQELPLVLDPTDPAIEPTKEIEFRRSRVQRRERWTPYSLTPRGRETITVCGLDRPGLLTLYADHVRDVVRPKLQPVLDACLDGDAQVINKAWKSAVRGLMHPARAFRALSHDAMKVLISASVRERYHLELDPPKP